LNPLGNVLRDTSAERLPSPVGVFSGCQRAAWAGRLPAARIRQPL